MKKIFPFLFLLFFFSCTKKLAYESPTYKQAVIYFNQNQFDSTIALLERQSVDLNDSALQYLGLAYFKTGKSEKGIEIMKKGIAQNDKFDIAYYNLGIIYESQHKIELALSNYDKAIALDPNYKRPIYNKAAIYFELDSLDQSFSLAKKALKIDPTYDLPYQLIAQIYIKRNQLDSALLYNRLLVNADSTEASNWFYLGMSESDCGNKNAALSAYSKSIALNPNSTNVYFNRATVYHQLKEWDLAKKDYLSAIELDSSTVINHVRLSRIYFETNQLDSSLLALNHALALDPSYPDAYLYLGEYYYKTGKKERACEEYKRAKDLGNKKADVLIKEKCK